MRPIVLITKMDGGGMETFCLELLRAWQADGTKSTLYTSYAGGVREGDLPDGVERVCWNLRALKSFVPLMRWLRTRPDDPCLCLSQELAVVLAVLKRLHLICNRVYFRESTDVMCHYSPKFHRLMRLLWPALDGFVEQSRVGIELTREICGRLKHVILVRNLISVPKMVGNFKISDRVRFACIGSFKPMKGQEFLLQQWDRSWGSLVFIGDGERRVACETIAHERGLAVEFHSWVADRMSLYEAADVVVVPSDYEGLPNVMLEALLYGVRVSARPTCTGATELLSELGLPETWPPERALAIADTVWSAAREKLIPLCDPLSHAREILGLLADSNSDDEMSGGLE